MTHPVFTSSHKQTVLNDHEHGKHVSYFFDLFKKIIISKPPTHDYKRLSVTFPSRDLLYYHLIAHIHMMPTRTSRAHLMNTLWQQCVRRLEQELASKDVNTWIRPLHAIQEPNGLRLLAPNQFVQEWIKDNALNKIQQALADVTGTPNALVRVEIGTEDTRPQSVMHQPSNFAGSIHTQATVVSTSAAQFTNNLNRSFTFDNFIQGKSNQLASAAARKVAHEPGSAYNPMFIYGGVGLGKTHLMHAIGNEINALQPGAKVVYLSSERFVADMVKAIQNNVIEEFKRHYRSLNALLIDDIQFFAGKERSQEEFFHTFNALLEEQQQVILTSDRYPKEVEGLEERLKSRFGWGLTVAIEPPELETRVAILNKKAEQNGLELPSEVAFFIAQKVRSNVRELEGALRRVMASASFTGRPIDLDFTKESLKDLVALQDKLVTIENIQKTVAEYYKIRVADLKSASRSRSITRPRQIAMALAKEMTTHSLPEIGDQFGGRDHTTVIHACKKIDELRKKESRYDEDYLNLERTLSS